ncbi:hypothetical protein PV773_13225 [Mesorhizobium sp. CC13]|uniref:hypothetical protein n=1 Tax=Mesorhizobium sp. CC13 TaxID=3029194 RepID=UPI003267DA8B
MTDIDTSLILQPEDLRPGDILLFRWSEPDSLARRISAGTGSPYTHAAIYVGDGIVAESVSPHGVVQNALADAIEESECVGVLRSQLGFKGDRPAALASFVTSVIAEGKPFHRHALVSFTDESCEFFDNALERVRDNYGQVATSADLAARSYFCSGFVVACLQAVGLIGDSAQVAYPPAHFSPAHLHADPTFGWLLGFLLPPGGSVPQDDPLMTEATRWADIEEEPWWQHP